MLLRRSTIVLLAQALGVGTPGALAGQAAVAISAGARYGTPLVRDSIVTPFDVRAAIAPMLAVTLALPSARGWGVQATLDFSSSSIRRHDSGGASTSLGRVSTAAFIVGVDHHLPARFFARAGVGALKYIPSERTGIFQRGSGPIAGLGALALGHALPFGGRHHLALEARYDVHWFTTPALRAEGFETGFAVHRVALVIRADARGGR